MKEFWINLPVKDINKSKTFFTKLGFTFNTKHGNSEHSACLLLGDNKIACMLFDEPTFKKFINSDSSIANNATEVLLSIDAESKEAVDEMAKKAVDAGGASKHKPKEMEGYMYGCIFTDIDGHQWNVLYMDHSKMPG